VETHDVTDLTRPLWDLAENVADPAGAARLQTVRLVWGKAWNVQGVVTAVAERFERFDAAGTPQRSWLRMRMLRTADQATSAATAPQAAIDYAAPDPAEVPEDQLILHDVVGGPTAADAPDDPPQGERLDAIAAQYYGDPSLWRVLADFNGIADPTHVPPPQTLRIPPLSALKRA
jgi:hypothetical protein